MRLSLIVLCALAMPAMANEQAQLDNTLNALKENQAKAKKLSTQMKKVGGELTRLENESQNLITNIRRKQKAISANRDEIRSLEARQKRKSDSLNKRRNEIARLLYGMIRLQRLPRHYMLAQPTDIHKLLRTASALDINYHASQRQIDALQADFAQLNALQARLKSNQLTLSKQLRGVEVQQATLTKTLAERRQMQQSLRKDHKHANARINELSQKSENLQQLIANLEAETLLFKNLGIPASKPAAPTRSNVPIAARKGGLLLPAAGRIATQFGAKRNNGETIEGIEIRTEAAAPVTAPHSGRIMFSGEFMDYGPMVIIEHDKHYHSVIAGLDLVEVQTGDPIATDGIIGVMGRNSSQRTLYFELRKNSKPIDPSAWIGNVSKIARQH